MQLEDQSEEQALQNDEGNNYDRIQNENTEQNVQDMENTSTRSNVEALRRLSYPLIIAII
ncbi:hypothetical protein OnM2_081055 [Erysiphe neolycopersici]|uniref:Uncharacterized protein n=1 Tax=Erysiphe neolycopersici TaxID=212602 RepID=A0A420HGH4_9PEZI|nr:hypothetical protein OnM2_081055 [Erysiphe neolycopersici]